MHTLRDLEITAKRDIVLEKLRTNRKEHAAIVAEARIGYVTEAQKAVAARLDELKTGEIVGLTFSLMPPQDHTDVYDTAIMMLELSQSDTVDLTADQVRHLCMDQWDWQDDFLHHNSSYSASALAKHRKFSR